MRQQQIKLISINKYATSAWIFANRILLALPLGVFIILLFVLLFNSSHGFDISDESYYLLWASQPENVLVSPNPFGYYTKFLYLLSGENITVFRVIGIFFLISAAGIFAFCIEHYSAASAGSRVKRSIRWSNIGLILLATLVYYRNWLLTPSFNWLALFCNFIVASGLLRLTTTWIHGQSVHKRNGVNIVNGLLVGIGGGIAFTAKPTTALILGITTIYWVSVHYHKNSWKEFYFVSGTAAFLILLLHAILFKGGIIPAVSELIDGVQLFKVLGAGQSIGEISVQAVNDLKQAIIRMFDLFPRTFLSFPIVVFVVRWFNRVHQGKKAIYVLPICLLIIILDIGYKLWAMKLWSKSNIGFCGLTLMLVLLLAALTALLSGNNDGIKDKWIPFSRLVNLVSFLILPAAAYAFGSSNGLLRQMSGAYVFFALGSLYCAYWIDHYLGKIILTGVVSLLIVIFSVLSLNQGYNNPYRLPENVANQIVKTSFLSGKGHLYVDEPTANYINDLKKIARKANWAPGMPLIDITGASPGASVILGARVLGFPWLVGGYSGSFQFVKSILLKVPYRLKRHAWILAAPNGRRKLPDSLLSDVGLNFPNDYVAVGTTISGHRNEVQVLWRPVNNDDQSLNN